MTSQHRRKRRKKVAETAVALVQVIYGGGGAVLSQVGVIGGNEPKLVLHLSWLALFFTGLVGLIAASNGD